MTLLTCTEGKLLVANASEALRRQCELPAKPANTAEQAKTMDTDEALKAANRYVTDHMMRCPICRSH